MIDSATHRSSWRVKGDSLSDLLVLISAAAASKLPILISIFSIAFLKLYSWSEWDAMTVSSDSIFASHDARVTLSESKEVGSLRSIGTSCARPCWGEKTEAKEWWVTFHFLSRLVKKMIRRLLRYLPNCYRRKDLTVWLWLRSLWIGPFFLQFFLVGIVLYKSTFNESPLY